MDTPSLDLIVTAVTTSVQQRTWDLGVTASIASLVIDDHYKRSEESAVSTRLLSNVASNDADEQPFLSVKYRKVYKSLYTI